MADPQRVPVVLQRDGYSVAQPTSIVSVLTIGFVVTVALYLAREILVPLAMAILLSFALGPLVVMLRQWHFGRVSSVIAAVLVAFFLIFGIGALVGGQIALLAENLPQYESNITSKVHSLQQMTASTGIWGRIIGTVRDLSGEIMQGTVSKNPPNATSAPRPSNPSPSPVPVEIHQPQPTSVQIIQTIIGPLLQPLATTGIVIVFVIFFLLQREDLRDRFIRLAGTRDLQRTTHALDDAARRLSRYLLAQTVINTTFGIVVGVGLWFIGVPNPLLWGILAMLLRFVPYIGAIIAASFPAAVALAVDPGWSMVLWTGALFLVTEPLMGQILEPLLYGHSTGLSPVAVIIAAAFWTWLWGPVGLLLSTPLTLCLVVLGRHVDQLEYLNIMLGDQPALTREENFYQRMLADDPDEAALQAEEFLKEKPLSAYYDEVAVRGLALAQRDVNRGLLDHSQRVRIKEAVAALIDNLSDHADAPGLPQNVVIEKPSKGVMCIAGRGSLDEAAAAMLAQLLELRGIEARVVPSHGVSAPNIFSLDMTNIGTVCLSYLEPGGFTNAHYLVRRLRRKQPDVRILAGFWTLGDDQARSCDAKGETGADLIVTSLQQAADHLGAAAMAEMSSPMGPAGPENQ